MKPPKVNLKEISVERALSRPIKKMVLPKNFGKMKNDTYTMSTVRVGLFPHIALDVTPRKKIQLLGKWYEELSLPKGTIITIFNGKYYIPSKDAHK